jgi:hypothetical protein
MKAKTRASIILIPRPKEDEAREHRITMEAVVDAYNESERAMGWYYYLEGKIKVPFDAKCIAHRAISPLKVGQIVSVLSMAAEEESEEEMFVLIEHNDEELAVPLVQLAPTSQDLATQEAIADWHYWCARGYEF